MFASQGAPEVIYVRDIPDAQDGCYKLLFKRVLKAGVSPDCFLVVARSDLTGQLAVGTEGWRSSDTWLVSFSECRGQQEAMLLMPVRAWIRSGLGRFVIESSQPRPCFTRLVLRCGE